MSSRDNLLDDVKSCSFEENDVENVCCTDTDGACRDGGSHGFSRRPSCRSERL